MLATHIRDLLVLIKKRAVSNLRSSQRRPPVPQNLPGPMPRSTTLMTPVGFEPAQLALVELESTPLDHSGKVSAATDQPATSELIKTLTF